MLALGDINTNLANKWSDLSQVKQRLWNKLHGVSSSLKQNVNKEMNRLAQVINKRHG